MGYKFYDCFMFFNEFDLLELRCNELKALNVTHVLCEATSTHSGKPHTPIFETQKDRFKEFDIRHIIVDLPDNCSSWDREAWQRESLRQCLHDADLNDLVIVSDVDEIPRAKALKLTEDLNVLDMSFYFYGINMKLNGSWRVAHVVRYGAMSEPLNSYKKHSKGKVIRGGGWHFSSLGGKDAIIEKIKAYAHIEHNTDEIISNLDDCLMTGKHFGNNFQQFERVRIDKSYPKFILNNMDKWHKYIL